MWKLELIYRLHSVGINSLWAHQIMMRSTHSTIKIGRHKAKNIKKLEESEKRGDYMYKICWHGCCERRYYHSKRDINYPAVSDATHREIESSEFLKKVQLNFS